jgi:hypothetical protein
MRIWTQTPVPVVYRKYSRARTRAAVDEAERMSEAGRWEEVCLDLSAQGGRRRRTDEARDERADLLSRVFHSSQEWSQVKNEGTSGWKSERER